MKSVIVIPARYNSSRFPGKPLERILGVTMLERTWRIAKSTTATDVLIATDDERIAEAAIGFGAEFVLTDSSCRNGTERTYQAVSSLAEKPDFVINLQGDAVLTPPWVIQSLVDEMTFNRETALSTPAVKLTADQYKELVARKATGIVGGTMVVFDLNYNAMYFSKYPIPFARRIDDDENAPFYRHIGLYAYRYRTLERYLALPPGELELLEGLEQLRALENGIPVKIVVVDYRGRTHGSVDSPEDIELIESIIREEGELVELPAFAMA